MRFDWHRRLNVQLVAMLTVALLPLGLIAILQTIRVAEEAENDFTSSLLDLTERAASEEQALLQRAVGAARLFGSVASELLDDPASCAPVLSRFVTANPEMNFVGVLPAEGDMTCSSSWTGATQDYAAIYAEDLAGGRATVRVADSTGPGDVPDFVVLEPFFIGNSYGGLVMISIPQVQLEESSERLVALGLVELVTFNENGALLHVSTDVETAKAELPASVTLRSLSTENSLTFRAKNKQGEDRRYSIVTVEGAPAAVMAVWEAVPGTAGFGMATVSAFLFPALMWVASLAVAMLAMNTLVLRHLRRLRRAMDRFADNRRIPSEESLAQVMPAEVRSLEENFIRMSKEILADEASLENAVREKSVLVKEIHHRVKNNLQMIASLMNFQIRDARHEETVVVLRRLQERVLSLATIHRDLYDQQSGGSVNAGALIEEVIDRSVPIGLDERIKLDLRKNIANIRLYPDQAVPLSLLVAEAATNAVKYLGTASGGKAVMDVTFSQDGRSCLFELSNSVGGGAEPDAHSGLGTKLMNAFAMQVGGKLEAGESAQGYTVSLRFDALEFAPEARDF